MSRIGNMPVPIPEGVSVQVDGSSVLVKGPEGERTIFVPGALRITTKENVVTVARKTDDRETRALHGSYRSELYNAITGVTKRWTKELELVGVGYRAVMSGPHVQLTVGFSHPVMITPPPGVTLSVTEGKIVVSGIDKRLVGQVAAGIRAVKKPEPYKGKGIKYVGERVRRKPGKSARAVGGPPAGGGK